MSMQVVLAEDHLLVREGIRAVLESGPGVVVAASVSTAAELVDAVDRHRPDAVLTDIRMPGGTGIQAAHTIRSRWPDVGVVVLSQHLNGEYARELFAHGSAGLGYLLKQRIGQRAHLVDALASTAVGGSVVDPLVIDHLAASRLTMSRTAQLSPRERDVLALMAQGLSNPTIGQRLHLSLSAVEKHVTAIFVALGLAEPEPTTHRRVAAVVRYLQAPGDPS